MPPHAAAALVATVAATEGEDDLWHITKCLTNSNVPKKEPVVYCEDDFRIVKAIGHGDMGSVFLVALRDEHKCNTGAAYAMKVMKKEVMIARDNLHRAETERDILGAIDHPFLPRLFANFETDKHTFLVTDYCCGGDLNVLRQKQPEKKFSETTARFYAAEVLLALEYLHKRGVVYRDLKPENILIQADGHVMLTDFDLSLNLAAKHRRSISGQSDGSEATIARRNKKVCLKQLFLGCGLPWKKNHIRKQQPPAARVFPMKEYFCARSEYAMRSNSFVGTEEYVAPEVVWGSGHGMAVDWWTFGILIYELVYGKTPFKGSKRKDTFYNILCKDPELPGPSSPLRDIISKLLIKNPDDRFGAKNGAAEVKDHAFFQGLQWDVIANLARPPFIPSSFSLEEFDKGSESKKVSMEQLLIHQQQLRERVKHIRQKQQQLQQQQLLLQTQEPVMLQQQVTDASSQEQQLNLITSSIIVTGSGSGSGETRTSSLFGNAGSSDRSGCTAGSSTLDSRAGGADEAVGAPPVYVAEDEIVCLDERDHLHLHYHHQHQQQHRYGGVEGDEEAGEAFEVF